MVIHVSINIPSNRKLCIRAETKHRYHQTENYVSVQKRNIDTIKLKTMYPCRNETSKPSNRKLCIRAETKHQYHQIESYVSVQKRNINTIKLKTMYPCRNETSIPSNRKLCLRAKERTIVHEMMRQSNHAAADRSPGMPAKLRLSRGRRAHRRVAALPAVPKKRRR
jgi:hypothetical protein